MAITMKRRIRNPCAYIGITMPKAMCFLAITSVILMLAACDSDKRVLANDFQNYEGLPEPFATCMAEEFIKAAPPKIVKQRIKLITGDFTPTELEDMSDSDTNQYISYAWDQCGKRIYPDQEQK